MNGSCAVTLRRVLVLSLAVAWLSPEPAFAQASEARVCESDAWTPGSIAMDAYLDSALLTAALRPQWNPDWGRVLATFSRDTSRVGDRVWVGTSASETEGLDRVAAWLVQARRDVPLTEADPHLMILVGDDGEFGPRSVEFTSCEPVIANRSEIADSLELMKTELRRHYNSVQLDRLEAEVKVRVSETGYPIDVELVTPSDALHFDEAVPGLIGRVARFDPGMTEGIPVPLWVTFPVSLNFSGY